MGLRITIWSCHENEWRQCCSVSMVVPGLGSMSCASLIIFLGYSFNRVAGSRGCLGKGRFSGEDWRWILWWLQMRLPSSVSRMPPVEKTLASWRSSWGSRIESWRPPEASAWTTPRKKGRSWASGMGLFVADHLAASGKTPSGDTAWQDALHKCLKRNGEPGNVSGNYLRA